MLIFSKLLSKTDVEKRCVVPMKYFRKKRFPKLEGNDMVCFTVKDESGRDRNLCCSKRKIGNDLKRPKHPKPVLIGGWIPFVRENKLCIGDTVIIDEEQDETGLMQLRVKVKKRTSPSEARSSLLMNEDLVKNKGLATNNSSTPTFNPFRNLSNVLNTELGGTNATPSSSTDEEQIPTPHSTSQDTACYNTEKPSVTGSPLGWGLISPVHAHQAWDKCAGCDTSQKLSLELTLKPTMPGGTTVATSSSIDKEQTPFPHSTSQDIASYRTEWPSLSLSSGLTSNPTTTGGHQHVYMQETEPKTIDFLGSLL